MNEPGDPPHLDAPGNPTIFAALRLPAFRWYLAGQTAAAVAMSALPVLIGWLSFDLTGSFTALGVLRLFATVAGALLILPAGLVVDRHPTRRVLVFSQVAFAVVMLALALTTASEVGGYPTLFVLRGFAGALVPFAWIAQFAVLPTIMGVRLLQPAVAWRGVALMLGGLIGPLLAGAAITFDPVLGSVMIAGFALLAALAFSRIASPELPAEEALPTVPVREGLRLVAGNGVLWGLLALSLVSSAVGTGSSASRVLDLMRLDPLGRGIALSGVGVIAALIPLLLIVRRPIRQAGRAVVLGFAASAVAGTLLASAISLPVAVGAALVGLVGQGIVLLLFTTNLLEATPDRLRGRTLALLDLATLVVGGASGWLVDAGMSLLDETVASVVLGALGLLGALLVARAFPALWRYESVARRAPVEAAGEPVVS